MLSLVVLTIIIGIWPAWIFSSFNPVRILGKGLITLPGKKMYTKNILTIFQFTVSIALIFCLIVIWKQIGFAENTYLGFNKDRLLRIDLPMLSYKDSTRATGMINDLKSNAYISEATVSNGVPGYINTTMSTNIEGKDKNVAAIYADSTFLKTFGIKLIEGSDFSPGDYGESLYDQPGCKGLF